MHVKKVRNHYEVMGVNVDATSDEIKRKYRDLAKKFHPDHAADKENAHQTFSQINHAYRVLVDPGQRKAYDMELHGKDHKPHATVASPHGKAAHSTAAHQHTGAPHATVSVTQLVQLLHDADHALVLGKHALAKALCAQILAVDPNNFRAFCILGDVLVQMNKNQKAISAYQQALKISSSPLIKSKLDRLQTSQRSVSAPVFSTNGDDRRDTPARQAGAPKANSLLSRLFRR